MTVSALEGPANQETFSAISMRRARAVTGARDREVRKLVARGALPPTDLSPAQVLALRCLSQLSGIELGDASQQALRDRDVLNCCADVWGSPAALSLFLLVGTSSARVFDIPREMELMGTLLISAPAQVYVALPIGPWASEILGLLRASA